MFLAALLRETQELGKGGSGDSSPDCTLAWEKPNTTLPSLPPGYFLADGADMLWNQTLGQAWELLCHHLVVRLGRGKTGKEGCLAWGPQSLTNFLSYDFPESLSPAGA